MGKPVIGLVGKAGSGKDTAARHIIERYGAARELMAGPLKRLCADIFDWNVDRLDELDYKESPSAHGHVEVPAMREKIREAVHSIDPAAVEAFGGFEAAVGHLLDVLALCSPGKTRRWILQMMGTEGFRKVDPEHWVKKAREAIIRTKAQVGVAGVFITDVRFPNEAAMIRGAFDGILVRVVRENATQGTSETAHASERAMDDIAVDHTIRAADGDIQGLLEAAELIWEEESAFE